MSSRRPWTGPMRASVRPHAHGRLVERGDVGRAVAQQRQRLLGQRRDHELARLARRDRLRAVGVEHLDEEVVLVDVRARRPASHSIATPGPMISDSP